MRVVRYGRAKATNPGKHGDLDWRVEFNEVAPTLAEILFMVGFWFLAEDRYVWGERRYLPWKFIKGEYGLLGAWTPEAILSVCEQADASVEKRRGAAA
jgi:hypothetical protein